MNNKDLEKKIVAAAMYDQLKYVLAYDPETITSFIKFYRKIKARKKEIELEEVNVSTGSNT